jgi:predicted CXXCH cytochrome family protein
MSQSRYFKFHCVALLWIGLLMFLAFAPLAAQRRPEAKAPPSVVAHLAPQPADAGYVGQDRCRACHKSEATEFHKTAHADVAEGSLTMDCETCHGAGKPHADAEEAAHGDDAKTLEANALIFAFHGTPQQNAARCLTCHITSDGQKDFAHSRHIAAGVSCQSCHATHLVVADAGPRLAPLAQEQFFAVPRPAEEQRWLHESLLKQSQPAVCYTCHAQVRGQFAQPFHHRVPEGAMKCTDCHNAHGTANNASLVSPAWETCTTCHVEKHGPFIFEHAAVRIEGCGACHTPHGADSRFILKARESRFLCLQCHGDQHSPTGQAAVPHSRLGFQTRGDCTRCHVAVHGSNFNRELLQ